MHLTREKTLGDRIATLLVNCTLASLLVLVSVVGVTMCYPFDPIASVEIAVVGPVRVGGIMRVSVTYCKTRPWVPAEVRWSLVNDITIQLPRLATSLPMGCQTKQLLLPVPLHVMPGVYKLQEDLIYRPWPWREFYYQRQSASFTVEAAR